MNTNRFAGLLMVLAVTGVAGYAVFALCRTERRAANPDVELPDLKPLSEKSIRTVTAAMAAEHEEVMGGFLQVEQVHWKLAYDRGKQKNFLEVRVRNPLRYHRVSFGLNFESETEAWDHDGRQAAPRPVSLDVLMKDIGPGEAQVVYVPVVAEVPTRAVAWWGKALDWFRWSGLPTVEPLVERENVRVRVYAEEAVWAEEPNQEVARASGN